MTSNIEYLRGVTEKRAKNLWVKDTSSKVVGTELRLGPKWRVVETHFHGTLSRASVCDVWIVDTVSVLLAFGDRIKLLP